MSPYQQTEALRVDDEEENLHTANDINDTINFGDNWEQYQSWLANKNN